MPLPESTVRLAEQVLHGIDAARAVLAAADDSLDDLHIRLTALLETEEKTS
ncbi:hypothetical protein [Jiangella alba]|uniref:Uncharacterized protein n=1 Tax=Jiangella alba TaxID=561176 RepID=A0A1H5MNK4_9ACTN|nr:hypothetical protein [Jiangella alba]SEE90929.1 hypothetical protein SAMN04488561_3303 [Jiangella alba]